MIDDTIQGAPEEGFLDIAANALAVILFVTMLLLLTVSVTSAGRPIPSHDKQVTLPDPQLGVLGPFRLYYIVSEHGITALDLSPFQTGFAEGQRRVKAEIGTATLSVDRQGLSARDMNAFGMTLSTSPAGIARLALPLETETDAQQALEALQTQLQQAQASALTVIVAKDGASRFARLFHRLDQGGIPFRMSRLPANGELNFGRKAVDFATRVRAR